VARAITPLTPRVVLATLAALLLIGSAASVADAHATYVRSNPAADARLVRAPVEVRAAFSETPDPRGSELAVFDVQGKRVDRSDTRPSDEPNGLVVSLAEIGDGGFTVAWTVLSAVDGHTTRGSFVFAVGDAPLPALPDVGEPYAAPRPLEIAGRALSFIGIALLVGGALFALLARPRASAAELRREQLLLAAGGGLLVTGAVALLLEQGGLAPPRLTALLSVRGLAGVAVLGAASFVAARRLRIVALAAGVTAAATATLVSHAAATGAAVESALDIAHVLAASTWAGGVVAMVAVVMPAARTLDPLELGRVVGRFSTMALVAVAVLVSTGLVQSFARLVLLQDLWETPYGLALLAKIVLLALTMALGALNLLVWGPRLRARAAIGASRRGLALGTAGETALFGGILVATALLTALVPPAQPSGAAYDETRHVAGLRLQLLLASTGPGQNRYVLRIQEGIRPVTDAQRVAFRFTMIEHDMGENELLAEQRAPGEYVAAGNATAMFGTWRIETIVRLPGEPDTRTTFEVPIGAPAGPGAIAKVVAAPPYSLVVFVDPPQPVAGAPLTLHAVIVDTKGDPVPGKAVTVTFTGPATETVPATETTTGRYEAAVAALAAGTWTATIVIGDGARGAYEFEVAR
jgi:copper transport protein